MGAGWRDQPRRPHRPLLVPPPGGGPPERLPHLPDHIRADQIPSLRAARPTPTYLNTGVTHPGHPAPKSEPTSTHSEPSAGGSGHSANGIPQAVCFLSQRIFPLSALLPSAPEQPPTSAITADGQPDQYPPSGHGASSPSDLHRLIGWRLRLNPIPELAPLLAVLSCGLS